MSKNINLLSDRVLIQPDPVETKTVNGLIIPSNSQEKSHSGIIVATGPGRGDKLIAVKEGNRVIYNKNAGETIKIEDESFLLLREDNIIGILK